MDQVKFHRLSSLDLLRGIAAVIVFIGHIYLMWPESEIIKIPLWLHLSPLRILINGYNSVILFFVLSGYVLSLPYLRNKNSSYISFITKRICRIYPPFALAILISAILFSQSHPTTEYLGSASFRGWWHNSPLTTKLILQHLAMTGVFNHMWLDGVMWSLVVEMRISIIFPLLIILCRNTYIAAITAVIIYIMASVLFSDIYNPTTLFATDNLWASLLITLRCVPFFILGIILAKQNEPIRGFLFKLSYIQKVTILIFTILIISVPTEMQNRQILEIVSSQSIFLKFVVELFYGISSGILIIFVRNFSSSFVVNSILNARCFVWLGKISYSLYLLHLPLTLFIFRILFGRISYSLVTFIDIIVTLLMSYVFFRTIEQPSIAIGHRLGSAI